MAIETIQSGWMRQKCAHTSFNVAHLDACCIVERSDVTVDAPNT